MQAGLRLCYKRGLDEDPTMQGSVRVTAQVGPNGEVRSASPSSGGSLSSGVIACVVNRVRSAQFGAPPSGGATVVIPMVFRVQ
jgi:TonB family protein